MPTKKKAAKKKAAKKVTAPATKDAQFWVDMVEELYPDHDDQSKRELVQLYIGVTRSLQTEWTTISRLTGDDGKWKFSIGFGLNRQTNPSEIGFDLSHTEKHGCKFTLTAEDPDQMKLFDGDQEEVDEEEEEL